MLSPRHDPAALPAACAGLSLPHAALRLRDLLPRPLVFTNGVFDILHAGHVACLEAARAHGSSLVVGVNGDASVRRLGKGPGRPVNPAEQRARVIGALAAVSAVLVFDDDLPLALLCALRPDVYVKGGDYALEQLPEAALVAAWGGRTVIVPRLPGLSTTEVLARAARLDGAVPPTPAALCAAPAAASAALQAAAS